MHGPADELIALLAAAVGADADAHAGIREPLDAAREPVPGGTRLREVFGLGAREARLQALDLLGRHGFGDQRMDGVDPRRIDDAAGSAEREREEHVRPRLQKLDQLVVDVADHVGQAVDIGAQEALHVFKARGVDHDADVVAVGFVDDRAVGRRREFADLAAAVIDPGLEHRDVVRLELLHRAADVVIAR